MNCFDCHGEINGPIVWLGEDYLEQNKGRVAYAFHPDCSLGAWPLFELTDELAREWIRDGAFTNAKGLVMDEITLTHQELAARRTEHGTTFYIEVNEDIALEIASGFVRSSVMAQVRAMLDWQETDERRANQPVKPRQKVSA